MAGRPDASAYPVAGVRQARRVSPFPAARSRSGERGLRVDRVADAPIANLQNCSADVDVNRQTLSHTHLPSTGRQVYAARPKAAALTATVTHRPAAPVIRSGG